MGIGKMLRKVDSFGEKIVDDSDNSISSSQRSKPSGENKIPNLNESDKFSEIDLLSSLSYTSFNASSTYSPSSSNNSFIEAYINDQKVHIADRMKLWYSTIPTNVINLYDLMGNRESIFVIHGESLLLHTILRAYKIGFDFTELISGQQTLQLFYLLERLISDLVESGGKFHIVFFGVYKDFFADCKEVIFMSSFPLLRELFLLHCKRNLAIPIYEFDNWFDDMRWFNYLTVSEPSCILLEDGSSFLYKYNRIYKFTSSTNSNVNKSKNTLIDITEEYLEWLEISKAIDKFCFTTHSLIYICIIKNLYVAYMFDMRRESSGFQIHNVNFSRTILSHDISLNVYKYLADYFNIVDEGGDVGAASLILAKIEEGYTLRDALAGYCYNQFIEANADNDAESLQINQALSQLLLKCTILHNYIIENLSLAQRVEFTNKFVPNDRMMEWEFYNIYVCGYLDFSFESIKSVIIQFNTINDPYLLCTIKKVSSQLVDLFDGKVMQRIIYDIGLQFNSNKEITSDTFSNTFGDLYKFRSEDINNITSIYEGLSGDKTGFFPIQKSNLENILNVDTFSIHNCGKNDTIPEENAKFTLLYNKLLLDEFNSEWINYAEYNKTAALVSNKLFSELGYRDPNDVIQKKDVIDIYLENQIKHKEAEPTKHLSDLELKRQQRIEQRNMQRYKQLSFLLSKYLGSNNLHHPIVVQADHVWIELKKSLIQSLNDDNSINSVRSDRSKGNKGKTGDKGESGDRGNKRGSKHEPHVSKAELLKQKNIQSQTKKKYEVDKHTLTPYEMKLNQISNDLDYGNIYNQILEFTLGPSGIGDMISDFKWVKSTFSTKEYQLNFLLILMRNVHNALEAFRLRLAKTEKELRDVRKCICLLFCLVKDIFNTYKPLVDRDMIMQFQKILISIGCPLSAKNMFNEWRNHVMQSSESSDVTYNTKGSGSKKLGSSENYDSFRIDPSKIDVLDASMPQEREYDIQLEYMGDIMERTLGSTEDKRVLFKPDGWQKLLLDVIDARSSALVCAPTAAGKTYICYYAMEQVLRMDDLGVVIYVSPNTALAFQVTYEITARFSSKIYRSSDISITPVLNASFLEKFHDPKWKCAQILVTVPQILEMLLLSLRNSEREYVRRIEYIIFDEIHCITHSDIGQYLERCIHLSSSPFLALSATIGNPSEFHSWLNEVNKSRNLINGNNGVHLATFDERYSDLKLAIYTIYKGIELLNPVTCLSHARLAENGFPIGFNICAGDCYAFVTTLFHFASKAAIEELEYLRPINYFSGSIAITKRQYRYYWSACKSEIERQIYNGNITRECIDRVYLSLKCAKPINYSMKLFPEYPILDINDPSGGEKNEYCFDANTIIEEERLDDCFDAKNFIKLLKDLDKFSGMPCLAFVLDRVHMEQLMISLVRMLEQKQHDKYYGTEEATLATKIENKRRMDKYNALVRQHEMDSKLKTLSREQREEQGIDASGLADEPLPPPPIDIAKEYDPEFNFSNRRIYTSYTDEVENFISMAKYSMKGRFGAEEYIEGLRRGIGIHHEGLPHKFTMFVETLFRMGYLKIVIASRTLAFGVNMPCRSVIFVGDNYELNSLMYQQMSGRCGRRGFDLSGNVIFWSIPQKKIFQLLTAALPSLVSTNHTCSPTLMLRNLTLFETLTYRDARDEASASNSSRTRHSQQKASKGKKCIDLTSAQIIDQCRTETLGTLFVSKRIKSIYQNPLALLNYEKSLSKDALRINSLLYTTEILVKLGLLDENGFPINCCEYPILLHQEHPTNLLIASALQTIQLHKLLAGDCEKIIAQIAGSKFISTCNILTPQNLPSLVLLNFLSSVTSKHSLTGSTVVMKRLEAILDGLEPPIQAHAVTPATFPMVVKLPIMNEIIDKYNAIISSAIPKYLQSCSKIYGPLQSGDYSLPLSRISFTKHTEPAKSAFGGIYSPFICLSGKFDDTNIIKDNIVDKVYLCQMIYKFKQQTSMLTCESIIAIEENVVQLCTVNFENDVYQLVDSKEAYLCNSYMMDFWLSGRFDIVRDRNGLGQYAWSYISKFLKFINFSRYMLKEYTENTSDLKYQNMGYDVVYHAFDDLYKRIEPLFSKI
ncbi:Uncharacterized helicase C694.02 [Babesia microti strain RI]|uniref:Uncharacterized helicase C694.02 n=1 Tax=Babesia microti (strain RI) TaxID=1133968 RepID=A0A1N6LXE9_BABMR|nr:Uncharacterized helicase C694.02 [Babesia microti strain RI]SIO73543.1 Uncharacterized helicase C694.02 [Babesia microti strain RI]|eukprot:XP_012649676.2 Uncharacterized helicase C694.02 [Babesia microti strain RI]